jgi:hypothetical protein
MRPRQVLGGRPYPMTDDKKTREEGADDSGRLGTVGLVELIQETYRVTMSHDGAAVAIPLDPRSPKIAKDVKSLGPAVARDLLRQRKAVSRDTMNTALGILTAIAEESAPEQIHLRAGTRGAARYLDLGDRRGTLVEVSAYGWEVLTKPEQREPAPYFRRTRVTKQLPVPERGGSPDLLRDLLGLAEDDPRWRLLWGWLVASMFPEAPRPLLWAIGPQGSGKSTRARMVLSVLDPADALGREPGRNERDDTTSASGRYFPSWDNIGTVSAATSDWLCRLVTGVEVGRRALYSDDDLIATTLRRSGVATSIVLPYGLGPDALERLVLVPFSRVSESERRTEEGLWQEFERRHAKILGALLDDAAGVLANLGAARDEPHPRPRMADYAERLDALDRHRGLDYFEGFEIAYVDMVRESLAGAAEDDPVTSGVLRFLTSEAGLWKGTPSDLLAALEMYRPDDPRAGWPHSERQLGSILTRKQETLFAAGVVIERGKSNGARVVTLRTTEDFDPPAQEPATRPSPRLGEIPSKP